MGYNSLIEWTATPRKDGTLAPGHTANLWWGCTEVHQGCDNCYARVLANRWEVGWGSDTPRKAIKGVWGSLLGMQAKAAAKGEIHSVFVGSMMDIFEKSMVAMVPSTQNHFFLSNTGQLRDRFFNEIVPNSPNLRFLLLTKRPSNINKYIPKSWLTAPPNNVMFGMSVVNEKTIEDYKRHFDKVNGPKFLSVEPQLEFIDFSKPGYLEGINWLIQGGESGPKKRPFNPDWARHTMKVCAEKNIPYFFKQIDKIQPIPADLECRQFP